VLEVSLEEIGIETVRRECQRLGISVAGMDKEQMIARIREVRAQSAPRPSRSADSILLSCLALIVAIFAMVAGWWGAYGTVAQFKSTLAETNHQAERIVIEDWQMWVVFSIVDKEFSKNSGDTGVGFDEIKSRYLEEAKTITDVPIGQEDIQDAALSRILMRLTRDQLIYKTHDDGYATNRAEILPGFGRFNRQEKAGYHILFALATERRKYDDEKLQTEVIDKFQLTPHEYRFLITLMIKDGYVVRDSDGTLYCSSKVPQED